MTAAACRREGWSHRPDEFASEADIANGVSVLALTLARLSGGTFPDGPADATTMPQKTEL